MSLIEEFTSSGTKIHEGVYKILLTPGEGMMPLTGNKVTMHYTGYLVNGEKFDSSLDRGRAFGFTIGANQVIKGFDIAVKSMQLNETSKFLIKSEYAYGESGAGTSIPPNSDLVFELQLLDIDTRKDKNVLTTAEKLDEALLTKTEANKAFKDGDYVKSSDLYAYAIDLLENYEEWTVDNMAEVDTIYKTLCVNLSISQYKLKNYLESYISASKVLKKDPVNQKAVYRAAFAKLALCDFDEALAIIKVYKEKTDDNSAELNSVLTQILAEKKKFESKEKSFYSKMFK